MKFRKNPERRQKGRSFKTKSKLEALTESTYLSHKQTKKKNETIAFFLLFFSFCQSKLRMKSQEKKGGNAKKKKRQ